MKTTTDTAVEQVRRSERIAHFEAEAVDTAAGALAGASIGAIAGPVGIAAGAAIGAAVGALVGVELEREGRKQAQHDRELEAAEAGEDDVAEIEDEDIIEEIWVASVAQPRM